MVTPGRRQSGDKGTGKAALRTCPEAEAQRGAEHGHRSPEGGGDPRALGGELRSCTWPYRWREPQVEGRQELVQSGSVGGRGVGGKGDPGRDHGH